MHDDLLDYYRNELAYLRKLGAEFKQKYPKVADRLLLDENESKDPHVERLLEGFAFLAARVHKKIDDDFPEITDALLNIVYPHYLRPWPSCSIVEFVLSPAQSKLTSGYEIPRGSTLYARSAHGVTCRFRTTFDTTLWPVEVAEASWSTPDRLDPPVRSGGAAAVIRLVLRGQPDVQFSKLEIEKLRLYLNGPRELPAAVYELLLNNCTQILLRDPNDQRRAPVRLSPDQLQAAGFGEDEALLPFPKRSFDGYRLLREYFAFPQKFQFIDLTGIGEALSGFDSAVEIVFFIAPFERTERIQMFETGVNERLFRLAATPAVNLFPLTGEPILLSRTRHEYRVTPDARRQHSMDIFSVDSVVTANPGSEDVVEFAPLYSLRHADHHQRRTYWYSTRRPTPWRTDGSSETYISLVDLSGRPMTPDADAVTCRLTCTNRDIPSKLPFEGDEEDFELEGGGPIQGIRALERPTKWQPPPLGQAAFWRLISHLSLNHLSLGGGWDEGDDAGRGRDALQELLRLYESSSGDQADRQISGIEALRSRPKFARVASDHGITFARGIELEMELNEENFVGAGAFLFANVLDRFLGMYTSINSFTQLTVRTRQRREVLRRWQPRSGRRILS
ncbi:MAG: type VI secretion system baseplate subunit TssF [Bryobacteraceae bacterium]